VYLYKIADGVCPKSHGMSVALTAGINQQVVDSAFRAAEQFEISSFTASYVQQIKAFGHLLSCQQQQRSYAATSICGHVDSVARSMLFESFARCLVEQMPMQRLLRCVLYKHI
jgi:DNA mismatch repair ATPase MutS